MIRPCTTADAELWAGLRKELWPEYPIDALRGHVADMLARPDRYTALLAIDEKGEAMGFAEASIRSDYVNGCDTSPVGFLEGIYIRAPYRLKGAARALCGGIEQWVRAQGCTEFASDTWIDNALGIGMHAALGFAETERVVYFRKPL